MRANYKSIVVALAVMALSATAASAAEIKIISVGGVKVALDKIIADYTKASGNTVTPTYGSPLAVSRKLAAGEVFDVVVQSAPAMEDYAKLGGVDDKTRIALVRGGIGMAVRPETTPPDIATPAAFKKTLLDAQTIAMTDTAMPNGSGGLTQSIFEHAGVMDDIKPKLKIVGLDPGQQQIAKGEIAVGFFNISEIRPFVKYGGPVPAPLQQYTEYQAAIPVKAPAPAAAAEFLKALTSLPAQQHWKSAGMEPMR